MVDITVYNSEGEEITPSGEGGRVDQQVKELSLGSVRVFAKRSAGNTEMTFFFRARETQAGRAEMFYARMDMNRVRPSKVEEFTSYVEDDLGLILANSERDSIYGKLFKDQTGVPKFKQQDYYRWAVNNTGQLTLGAGNMRAAIGAIQEYSGNYNELAIVKGGVPDVLDGTAFVVRVGETPGNSVEPIGSTSRSIQQEIERRERRRRRQRQGGAGGSTTNWAAIGAAGVAVGSLLLAIVYVVAFLGFLPGGYGGCFPAVSGDCPFGQPSPTADISTEGNPGALSVTVSNASRVSSLQVMLTGPQNTSRYESLNYTVTNETGLSNDTLVYNYTVPEGTWNVTVRAENSEGVVVLYETDPHRINYRPFDDVAVEGEQIPHPSQKTVNSTRPWSATEYRIDLDEQELGLSGGVSAENQSVRIEVGDRTVREYNQTELQRRGGTLNGTLVPPADGSRAEVRIVYTESGDLDDTVTANVTASRSSDQNGTQSSSSDSNATPTATDTPTPTDTASSGGSQSGTNTTERVARPG